MHLMCITISIFACVDFTDPLNQFRYSIFSLLREHLSDFEFWPRIVKSPMTAPPWQDQSSLSPRCAPHTSSSRLHWRLVRFQLLRWSGLKLTGGCGVEEIFFKRGESTKAPAKRASLCESARLISKCDASASISLSCEVLSRYTNNKWTNVKFTLLIHDPTQ